MNILLISTTRYRQLCLPCCPAVCRFRLCGSRGKATSASGKRQALELNTQEMQKPRQGDLPGMLDRRVIRVLTTYSKTFSLSTKVPSAGQRMTSSLSTNATFNQQLMKEKSSNIAI